MAGKNRFGQYFGTSNMMESEGLGYIADEMRESFGDKKINFVHDGDNKSPKIYKRTLLNEEHYRDPGHAIKSLRNAFDTVKKSLCFK